MGLALLWQVPSCNHSSALFQLVLVSQAHDILTPIISASGCAHGQCGCLVVNAPTANTVAAAEHGIALICALSRNVAQADASMKQGKWERSKYVGVSIVGKTLAVMGFGKVGDALSQRLIRKLQACIQSTGVVVHCPLLTAIYKCQS